MTVLVLLPLQGGNVIISVFVFVCFFSVCVTVNRILQKISSKFYETL